MSDASNQTSSGLTAEVAALHANAALFDLVHHAPVEIRGKHAERFLHSMLSQDVKSMVPGEPGRFATFLTDTGKTVGTLLLLRLEDRRFLALTPPGALTGMVPALQRFVLAQDVVFTDLSATTRILSVQGPRAPHIVAIAASVALDVPFKWIRARVDGMGQGPDIEVTVVENGRSGERGFDLLVPLDGVEAVWTALRDAGAVSAGERALDVARVEAGIPWLGRELDEDTIPLEAHLRHAISYKKGCYIGQETIAMTTYRGQAPRLLRGLLLEPGPLPGRETLYAGTRKAGVLTSAVQSPELGPIALALVKNKLSEPGTMLHIGEGGPQAEVVELPFLWRTGLHPKPVDE